MRKLKLTTFDIVSAIILVLLLSFIVVHKPRLCIVNGESMMPTIRDHQLLLSVNPSQIERGDIVVIRLDDGELLIKRIIGIPHDTVHIHDGRVYVNEVVFDDFQTDYAGLVVIPFTLGEGRYFVLGDNRGKSLDSRYPKVSILDEEQIWKKVVFIN